MLLLQIQWENPLLYLAIFFVTGLVAMIVMAFIVQLIISRKRRQVRKAGVDLPKDTSGVSMGDIYALEGCGYCFLFAVIIILSALGISLPIILPQAVENIIMAVVMTVFGGLCWGVTIWAIPYTRKQLRKLDQLLKDGLSLDQGA